MKKLYNEISLQTTTMTNGLFFYEKKHRIKKQNKFYKYKKKFQAISMCVCVCVLQRILEQRRRRRRQRRPFRYTNIPYSNHGLSINRDSEEKNDNNQKKKIH